MKLGEVVFLLLVALAVALLTAVAVHVGLREARESASCENRGGLLMRAGGGRVVCLEGAREADR